MSKSQGSIWLALSMVCFAGASHAARVVEEVVVTAQKTEQSLQDVPISISTLDAQVVQDAAIDDIQDMVQYVPNVKFSSANVTPVVSIRGLGSGLQGRGLESPVGSVIDDVFFALTSYLNDGVFDVKRMDVLRGPQGALFGKNTIAGVLDFTTQEAGFEWETNVSATFNSLGGQKYEGGVTLPVIEDKLGMRLSFRSNRRNLGAENTFNDQDYKQEEYAGRIKLLWAVNDELDVHLNTWYSHRDVSGGYRPIVKATEQALEEYRKIDPEAEDDPWDGKASVDTQGFFARRSRSAAIKAEWRPELEWLENATVTGILSYGETRTPFNIDADYSPIRLLEFATHGPDIQEQESLELRFSGKADAPFGWGNGVDLLFGLFGQRQLGEISNLLTAHLQGLGPYINAGALGAPDNPAAVLLTPAVIASLPDESEEIDAFTITEGSTQAFFTQAIWYVRDDLDLTLGLRLGREHKTAEAASVARGNTGIAPVVLGQEDYEISDRRSENEVSPKIALSWHVNDEITLFGNVTKGFKSGGFQAAPLNPRNFSFEPENAISTEFGVKARLFDGSLVVNANVFRTAFDNLQVINFDGTNFTTDNAAKAVTQGFEMDFVWLPAWEALTVNGSIGTTDATYSEYPCAPVAEDGSSVENPACDPTNSDADPTNDGTGTPGQDLSGKTLVFTPELTASLYPSLKFPLFPKWNINGLFAVDIIYQSESFLDSDLDRNTIQPAVTKINARFGMRSDSGWGVVFNAKNITGERESGAIIDQPVLPNNYVGYSLYDEPLYTLDFRYKWPVE